MSINDLPAIMGTVLIVAGLALVGVSTWSRAEGSDKTTQAGALIIVVGAFLLGLSIFVSHGKQDSGPRAIQIRTLPSAALHSRFVTQGRSPSSL
jgi:hypothetical protein